MLRPPPSHLPLRAVGVSLGTLVAVLAVMAGASAPSARGDTIAQRRAEARRIEAQIQAFDMKLERTIQRYDGAVTHLHKVRKAIRLNRIELGIARSNLRQARGQLRELVVGVYKNGEANPASVILASKSIQDLVDNIDAANRTTSAETDLLRSIAAAERQIVRKRAELKVQAGQARRLVARAAAAKRSVLHQLNERKQMLASVKASIRRLIHEQEERQARLAAERAAQSAAPTVPTGPLPPASSV
ncbi:MAG TPA: hypothetical protein VFH74_05770, partial [Gaiellales bacterium]|nr:hypothetical protein [Gaiellales bacterium]